MVAVTSYILAGGLSSRFGEDKALSNVNGIGMLQNVVNAVEQFSSSVCIIARDKEYDIKNTHLLHDVTPRIGPLGGILTAYKDCHQKQFLLLSCDLPYLTKAFVDWFLQQVDKEQTNWLIGEKGAEPLIAVYHEKDHAHLLEMFSKQEFSVRKLSDKTGINFIDASNYTKGSCKEFVNINYKKDLLQ